jgi:hypothetical protein
VGGIVWIGCEIAAMAGVSLSPTRLAAVMAIDPCCVSMVGGICLLYCFFCPSWGRLAAILAAGLALAAGLQWFAPQIGLTLPVYNNLCLGLGLAALGGSILFATGPDRTEGRAFLLLAAALLGSTIVGPFFLFLGIQIHPVTYDAQLYAADGALGLQPSFVVGQWLARFPFLAQTASVFYETLALMFLLILVLQLRAARLPVLDILPVFLIAGVAGVLLYLVFPVVGPVFAFGTAFPNLAPPVGEVLANPPASPLVPRNCMPSLHMAWTLLFFWHARPFAVWVRVLAGTYLAFTVLATLGFGLHYLVDLVVAFPFALAIQAICLRAGPGSEPRRRRALVVGILLTSLWFVVLLHGLVVLTFSPVLTAVAALLTVVGCVLEERGLYWTSLAASQQGDWGQLLAGPHAVRSQPLPSACPIEQ